VRLTHYGHACVVIDDPAGTAGRILIDPGNLAGDISEVGGIDAVLITHEHPDHLDQAKLGQLRRASPSLELYGSPGTPGALPPGEQDRLTVLSSGGTGHAAIAGWEVAATTTAHATIYPALPDVANNAYRIGRVWHPGDALTMPPQRVEVLLLPIGAPWLKLSEAIDYLRAVAPDVAIPVHQGGLAPAHRELHCGLLARFAPQGTELLVTSAGVPVTV
jgi:L-ascorbate metabolism protein UlaG (beta-lactamase superfamily)